MSPRRRLMFAVLAAIAVLAVGGLALRAVLRREPVRVPDQAVPGPVLLVPGYGGGTAGVDRLAAAIRATGRSATVVEMPDGGTGDLAAQADVLDGAATRALRAAPSVDVIGYSAGGVVARLWVRDHDGVHKARRVVTLGSPHQGARLAAAGAAGLPGACPAACQQLAPGSTLLKQLGRGVPNPPQWLSIWTEQDQTVVPPDSARLDGAVDVDIQQACPGREVGHGDLPTDDYVTGLVLDAIGTAPIAAPPPC
ncbi:esterase/lipase family protein [Dactylosporangium sp. CA-052675]|uniref:esterase/lipase family protein n=1 Tax=Dactylosporangium sp. CA-052675 TaxID=3239927 RepID=UPI003D9156D2